MSKTQDISSDKIHEITFCTECSGAIPAKAMTCLHCGAKQNRGEKIVRIVFCEQCGGDYPAQAHACFHCGHVNPRSRYLGGQISA
ncbi:MAG: zinc ribbon domain-containing protein [Planctomycetota bacterium]